MSPHPSDGSPALRRATLAVMFVDIVGYTGLCEHETPEVVVALLRRFHGLVRAVIGLNDGTVELTAGDCAMATFEPEATEGRPAGAALACAFALRDRVACFNAFDKPAGAPPLKIGIGIHIGPVVRAELGEGEAPMMIGDTVKHGEPAAGGDPGGRRRDPGQRRAGRRRGDRGRRSAAGAAGGAGRNGVARAQRGALGLARCAAAAAADPRPERLSRPGRKQLKHIGRRWVVGLKLAGARIGFQAPQPRRRPRPRGEYVMVITRHAPVPFAAVLAPVTQLVAAALDGLGRAGATARRAWEEERQIRALTRFDDHLLNDIGLDRDEIAALGLGRRR